MDLKELHIAQRGREFAAVAAATLALGGVAQAETAQTPVVDAETIATCESNYANLPGEGFETTLVNAHSVKVTGELSNMHEVSADCDEAKIVRSSIVSIFDNGKLLGRKSILARETGEGGDIAKSFYSGKRIKIGDRISTKIETIASTPLSDKTDTEVLKSSFVTTRK